MKTVLRFLYLFLFFIAGNRIQAQVLANFSLSDHHVCGIGSSITANDLSTGTILGWYWQVTPSTGSNVSSPFTSGTTITFNLPGAYAVQLIVTDGVTADTATQVVNVYTNTPGIPSICMVTCDANSVNNLVLWDKSSYSNVDSFIVYREVSPTVYARIGAVSNDSLSQFTDTARSIGPANGDPNIASYRYKLQVLDSCGNYSVLSLFHSTIYITDDGGGLFSWSQPYTIESSSSPVSNYVLLCDTAGVNVWTPAATVGSGASSAIDPGFSSHPTIANWRVKTGWSILCTPTRTTINTSRSNIKHGNLTTSVTNATSLAENVWLYPNPAADVLTVVLTAKSEHLQLRIENMLGQLVLHEDLSTPNTNSFSKQLDVSGWPKGVYLVHIDSSVGTICKKLIIQ